MTASGRALLIVTAERSWRARAHQDERIFSRHNSSVFSMTCSIRNGHSRTAIAGQPCQGLSGQPQQTRPHQDNRITSVCIRSATNDYIVSAVKKSCVCDQQHLQLALSTSKRSGTTSQQPRRNSHLDNKRDRLLGNRQMG